MIHLCIILQPDPIISSLPCFLQPLFNTFSVFHRLLSPPLGNLSLQDWSEPNREQQHYCELLSLGAAGRQAFAKLRAHNTQTHAACWNWCIHVGSQKYKRRNEENNSIYSQLTKPQPKAAASHHNGAVCLWFLDGVYPTFPPIYFNNQGKKSKSK